MDFLLREAYGYIQIKEQLIESVRNILYAIMELDLSNVVNKLANIFKTQDEVEFDLQSTALMKVKYNNKTRLLTLIFPKGDTYEYNGVPVEVFAKLLAADSKGKFFQSDIRKKFNDRKVMGAT